MTKKIKRITFLIIISIVIAIIIVGYNIWNKPHLNVKNADAIKTTAVTLYAGLSQNDSTAKLNYLNKVVEVSGEITGLSLNHQNQQIILLKTNVSGGSVNCTMEKKVDNLKAGDTIILKGICSGYIAGDMDMGLPGDVFLVRCYPSEKN